MKKKIWIVSHYSMPPEFETRVKTLKYASYLMKHGYDVLLFTASTLHNTDINLLNGNKLYEEKKYGELKYIHIYCHPYVGNGIKRILNMQEFSHKFYKIAKNLSAPDLIIAADMNCTNYKPIFKYCKNKKIPMIIDIRDLWPESIVEYMHVSSNNPIIKYLYKEEKKMYQNVDCSIISCEGGKDYIIEKGWQNDIDLNRIKYINNGVDLKEFHANIIEYKVDEPLFNEDYFNIVYTGSVRIANNLESIVNASRILKSQGFEKIRFIIYGDGPDKERLKEICNKENLNICFQGSVNKKFVPFILSNANVTILNYQHSNMFRFGGSQNKLFEYMAAGKPIISNIHMAYDPIIKNNIGTVLKNKTDKELAEACVDYYQMNKSELFEIEVRAKKAVKEYDFEYLCDKLLSNVKEFLGGIE